MSGAPALVFTQPDWAERRSKHTISCRDTDQLPKVSDAGAILDRDGEQVQVMHNGVLIHADCYYGEWTTRIIEGLRGHHEPQEEVAFAAVLDMLRESGTGDSPTIVELGSFWAYYSLWFLQAFPDGKAVCMEPDPRYLEIGRSNFALNGRQGVFLHGVIGDGTGSPVAFTPESDQFATDAPLGTIEVPQYSLDELAAQAESSVIDVLMVDIQGAETPLLEASLELLRDGLVRYALISTHHHFISGSPITHQRVLELVGKAGGEVLVEHSVPESFSGDGLVVASFVSGDVRRAIHVSLSRARDSFFGELEFDLDRYWSERDLLHRHIAALTDDRDARGRALDSATATLAVAQEELAQTRAELSAMLESRSWRMTGPLRDLKVRLHRGTPGASSGPH